jgi:hypothetical protein
LLPSISLHCCVLPYLLRTIGLALRPLALGVTSTHMISSRAQLQQPPPSMIAPTEQMLLTSSRWALFLLKLHALLTEAQAEGRQNKNCLWSHSLLHATDHMWTAATPLASALTFVFHLHGALDRAAAAAAIRVGSRLTRQQAETLFCMVTISMFFTYQHRKHCTCLPSIKTPSSLRITSTGASILDYIYYWLLQHELCVEKFNLTLKFATVTTTSICYMLLHLSGSRPGRA